MSNPDPHVPEGHDEDGAHIAIVGLDCRFPGADDADEFWRNLLDGRDTITRSPTGPDEEFVPARGVLDGADRFDAGYFDLSPRDASLVDPQHRVLLECAVGALEDAGCDPNRYAGAVGIYAGGTETAYERILRSRRDEHSPITEREILLGTAPDFLVTRVAHHLGLRGPAVAVQTACSTSLVAVHQAVQGLLVGDSDLALAGGVAVHVPTKEPVYTEDGVLSPDGTCRAFDAAASGTVGSNGVGLVALKRLDDALADGDRVRAVLRGSAINNDGASKVGYTAPSVDGQADAVREAQLAADVDAATITYVEAHGTATPLGDPIEVAALTEAFRADTDRCGFCWIGSVKTNIGHADTAAGAASLIKTVLALEHGVIPPSLHFTEPNPKIDFESSPFRVAARRQEWRPDATPRRAGVSSFGIGGTNAHLVLEEPPAPTLSGRDRPWQLVVLSARTESALESVTERLAEHLRAQESSPLADVARTLQVGRREHEHRRCAVVRDRRDALRVLAGLEPDRLVTAAVQPEARCVAFVLPGSGFGATAGGLLDVPEFRRAVEECCDAVAAPIHDVVFTALRAGERPIEPWKALLLAFVEEYALARLMTACVQPGALVGSGVGTLVVAAVARVLPLTDALRLASHRASDGDAGEFDSILRGTEFRTPETTVLSNVDGRALTADDTRRWGAHLLAENGMDPALSALRDEGALLVGVGTGVSAVPGRGTLAPSLVDETADPDDAFAGVLRSLGHLWLEGAPIRWEGVHEGERRTRGRVPGYPFERQRHIVEPQFDQVRSATATTHAPPEPPELHGTAEESSNPPEQPPERTPALDVEEHGTLAVVSALFAETLGLAEVDPDDSFFDLGGDSLIANRLLVKVRQLFPVELSVRAMFGASSAAEFAELIDESAGASGMSSSTD